MYFSTGLQSDVPPCSKHRQCVNIEEDDGDQHQPILPGLPDDVAKYCLALIPRSYFPVVGTVCKQWRSFIQSKEFLAVRKEAGKLEEWLYVLTGKTEGGGSHWEVVTGGDTWTLPAMPGQARVGFEVAVLDGKLLVMAGVVVDDCQKCVSADVYQYDSRLNSWSKLANMNIPRYEFACAELNGLIYVIGGYGSQGDILSSAEVYDPSTNKWSLIEDLQRPRCCCFAYGLNGKLYVMGGRSSFTIGNNRYIDIYDPQNCTWEKAKNGCVMVVAHAMLSERLFCIEWRDQRKMVVFSPADNSLVKVPMPVTGNSSVEFCFGTMRNKLLLFPMKKQAGFKTLEYDPDAPAGCEWKTSELEPSGVCLSTVTIET